jgi:hypothetical protein
VGPRFSGKVREERLCREGVGKLRNQDFCDLQTQYSVPAMETEKETGHLSPHPFQPSRREKVKKQEDRGIR